MDRTVEDKPTIRPVEKPSTTIQTLSPEILAEIFMHCLPTYHDQRPIPNRSQAPWLLGSVCTRWWFVSTSSPDLWSTFMIAKSKRNHYPSIFDATKLCISRSGSRPLFIRITHPRSRNKRVLHREDFLPTILDLIASHSWRWKVIEIDIPGKFGSVILSPFRTGHLPQLVNFTGYITGSLNTKEPLLLSISSVPHLQTFHHVSSDRIRIDFGGQKHHIKILNIRFPKGVGMSLDDLLSCLTYCPFLEELTLPIYEIWPSHHRQEIPSTIELSRLREFSLTWSQNIDPGFLFDILFLPALQVLELSMDMDNDAYADWPHLKVMLTRSRPPLQSLRLFCITMKEQTLIDCISHTPSLVSLYVNGTECTDTTLNFLTMDENINIHSRRICPHLETIDFDSRSHFSTSAMIAMILSRRPRPTNTNICNEMKLKNIIYSSSVADSLTVSSHPEITECMANGLYL
ncbi:hypothetical protein BD410DRAFT_795170 [Rickenella mellea]|uniref:F-box domain-containing protein n=1 Tax=Rickenella mellea TaxID=50990 RepID=A0A4Y7PME0_9AGAM|nr:hypothetical protein BD410DRAFT_795170 [Rickenella mellea]